MFIVKQLQKESDVLFIFLFFLFFFLTNTGVVFFNHHRCVLGFHSCRGIYRTYTAMPYKQVNIIGKRGSRVVSALASCARGPGFDPRQRREKFIGPNTLPFVSFAGMT